MNKILVVSDIYYETQYFVKRIPKVNEFEISTDITNIIGSKTLNAARVLKNLGNNTNLWGKVGSDGKNAIEGIKDYGISTNNIETIFSSKTGQIVVQTNITGLSSITLYSGVNSEIHPDDFEKLEKSIKDYKFVYAATNLPLESLYKLAEICKRNEVGILVDFPNQQQQVQLDRLSDVDFIVPNRQEAELLLSIKITTIKEAFNALKEIRKKCFGNIIISLDKDGCVLLEKNSEVPVHFKALSAEVIDATASGDILRATFLSFYLIDSDLSGAIQKAVNFATESVKMKGVDYTIKNLDYNNSGK
ncbi:PfkB family carbohydrate kinase [Candidatus Dojkabacteria bacterium]|jgi:sugar/nucleoside kinase (ribokinase family)|nr:PfkB family carbohydrate kinase [Candidatus Dojkabacteria bacterium]